MDLIIFCIIPGYYSFTQIYSMYQYNKFLKSKSYQNLILVEGKLTTLIPTSIIIEHTTLEKCNFIHKHIYQKRNKCKIIHGLNWNFVSRNSSYQQNIKINDYYLNYSGSRLDVVSSSEIINLNNFNRIIKCKMFLMYCKTVFCTLFLFSFI